MMDTVFVPTIKHGIFTWNIINFILCLPHKTYRLDSPLFSIDHSTWILQLKFRNEQNRIKIQVRLCRFDKCTENSPHKIQVKYSLTLKTPSEVLYVSEVCEDSFEKEGVSTVSSYQTDWKEFHSKLENSDPEETLVIVCDMMALGSSFDCLVVEDKGFLSEEIMQLLNFPNEFKSKYELHTEDKSSIPVHREILSSHSTVFKKEFNWGDKISIPYSKDVVQDMLKFIYSGDISKVLQNGLPSPKLYNCASRYKILDLVKLLQPKMMYSSTVIKCKVARVAVTCPHFSRLLSAKTPGEWSELQTKNFENGMKDSFIVDKHVMGSICPIHSESNVISFEAEFWNINQQINPNNILGLFHIVDRFGSVRYKCRDVFNFKETHKFNFYIQKELLKCEDLYIDDALRIECHFKVMSPDKICVSGPEYNEVEFNEKLANYDQIFKLDKRLGGLLGLKEFKDVILTTKSNRSTELKVHKSIMSARSPVFRDLLQNGNRIFLDTSIDVARALVAYVYTETLDNPKVELYSLYEAADKYKISGLREKCIQLISSCSLNHKNILEKYKFAAIANDIELKKLCHHFILNNKDLIFGAPKWQRFKTEYSGLAREILTSIK